MLKDLHQGGGDEHCTAKFYVYVDNNKGQQIDIEDFGYIIYGDDQPEYGCSSRSFCPGSVTTPVLDKYAITVEEFSKVAEFLRQNYRFGNCGACS